MMDGWDDNHSTFNKESYLGRIQRRFQLIKNAILSKGKGKINSDQIQLNPGNVKTRELNITHTYEINKNE